eukprot:m.115192 g.115192  ORF g.115192 m.115192 type:complete len:517 (-) comp16046_c1_seq2:1432-2982(-)
MASTPVSNMVFNFDTTLYIHSPHLRDCRPPYTPVSPATTTSVSTTTAATAATATTTTTTSLHSPLPRPSCPSPSPTYHRAALSTADMLASNLRTPRIPLAVLEERHNSLSDDDLLEGEIMECGSDHLTAASASKRSPSVIGTSPGALSCGGKASSAHRNRRTPTNASPYPPRASRSKSVDLSMKYTLRSPLEAGRMQTTAVTMSRYDSGCEPESPRSPIVKPQANPPQSHVLRPTAVMMPAAAVQRSMQCQTKYNRHNSEPHVHVSESEDAVTLLPDGQNVRGDRLAPCGLPTVPCDNPKAPEGRFITPETLIRLMHGQFRNKFDDFVIVDCRFPYEYEAGHINHSRSYNCWRHEFVEFTFLQNPVIDLSRGERTAIIFHCEFSSVRAPTLFQHLRSLDRTICLDINRLIFPEMYILQGGYKAFFDAHTNMCVPRFYRTMDDSAFKSEFARAEIQIETSRLKAREEKWRTNGVVHRLTNLVSDGGLQALATVRRNLLNVPEVSDVPCTPEALITGN